MKMCRACKILYKWLYSDTQINYCNECGEIFEIKGQHRFFCSMRCKQIWKLKHFWCYAITRHNGPIEIRFDQELEYKIPNENRKLYINII